MVDLRLVALYVMVLAGLLCLVGIVAPFPVRRFKPASIPDHAVTIGPDGYMRAWLEGGRVRFVFRNMPRVTVSFDRRAVPDLIAWMAALEAENAS